MGCGNSKAAAVTQPHAATAPMDEACPTLYINYLSPVARAVVIVAASAGVKVNIKEIDLPSGENKKEEYLKINPKGTVPAMTCGDEVICESNDIAKKIVSLATNKGLYPEAVQAKVDEILDWIQTDLYPACGGVSLGAFTGTLTEEATSKMHATTLHLNTILGEQTFLTGDSMTLADIFAFSCLTNTKLNGLYVHPPKDEIPGLIAWGERLRAQPWFASTHATFFAVMKQLNKPSEPKVLPTLYVDWRSPVSRAAAITAALCGKEVQIKVIDLFKAEHKTEDYAKINPKQTVPSLVDGETIINQSRDIAKHLTAGHALYPDDKKEKIDELLELDDNVIFPIVPKIIIPFLQEGKLAEAEHIDAMHEQMLKIQEMIGENDYVTGDSMTIADIFLFCNFTQCYLAPNYKPPENHAVLKKWAENMKSCDELNVIHQRWIGMRDAIQASKKEAATSE